MRYELFRSNSEQVHSKQNCLELPQQMQSKFGVLACWVHWVGYCSAKLDHGCRIVRFGTLL